MISPLNTPTRRRGIEMMVLSATLVSTSGLIFRSFDDIGVFEVVFFRSVALVLMMCGVISWAYGWQSLTVIRKIGFWGVLGAAFFAGAQTSYVLAFSYTSVANITFTIATAPFLTAILARFLLGEKISKQTIFAMLVAAVGIGILFYSNVNFDSFVGTLLAFLTACCFSCFAVILRKRKDIEMLPVLLVTGLLTIPVGIFLGSWEGAISLRDISLCLIWGAILQGFGQSLLITASKVLKAAEVPLIMLLEFTLGPFWVWLFLNEIVTFGTLIGGSFILASILGLTIYELKMAMKRV
jgi:drug/metabolite transporter (DMT)-like permease